MTDRELLELAAKAAELKIEGDADKLVAQPERYAGGFSIYNDKGGSQLWNPLTDDGDALRLAVKLHAHDAFRIDRCFDEMFGNDDHCAATRRAIVRAAAEIGRRDE